MGKTEITLSFDDEKLAALEFSLKKERTTVRKRLEQELEQLYEQTVPAPLREYLDDRAGSPPRRPSRPSAKERPVSSGPEKEGGV